MMSMQYSVCLDAVYNGIPDEKALEDVSRVGFQAVEFWGWSGRNLDLLETELRRHQLHLTCFCTEGGCLSDREAHSDYLEGLKRSIEVAHRLGCTRLITQTGLEQPSVSHKETLKVIAEGLWKAVPVLQDADIHLMVEPICRQDIAGYSLVTSRDAKWLLDEVDAPQIRLLYDIYHQQISEGNLLSNIQTLLPRIDHFHAAGIRNRGCLHDGEVNYPYLFREIARLGYEGAVGLEYFRGNGDKGFSSLPAL